MTEKGLSVRADVPESHLSHGLRGAVERSPLVTPRRIGHEWACRFLRAKVGGDKPRLQARRRRPTWKPTSLLELVRCGPLSRNAFRRRGTTPNRSESREWNPESIPGSKLDRKSGDLRRGHWTSLRLDGSGCGRERRMERGEGNTKSPHTPLDAARDPGSAPAWVAIRDRGLRIGGIARIERIPMRVRWTLPGERFSSMSSVSPRADGADRTLLA
jgi:hypothetical protein